MRPILKSPDEFIKKFWRFYQVLESDLLSLERYITIEENNFKTYSLELMKLFQSICNEIDVVAKVFCGFFNINNVQNMEKYAEKIKEHCPKFSCSEIGVYFSEKLILKPWGFWDTGKAGWWKIYNKTKHERLTMCTDNNLADCLGKYYYQCANLENTINALSALFILEFYCVLFLCSKADNYQYLLPCFDSSFFNFSEWNIYKSVFMGQSFTDDARIRNIIKNYIV